MREAVLLLRERGSAPTGTAAAFVARHRPTWIIAAAGAVLLAGVGAFETGQAAPWTLYSYWALLMFTGGAVAALAFDRLEGAGLLSGRQAAQIALLAVAVSLAMTPFVYVLSGLALHGSWAISRLPHLWGQALLITAAFLTLQWFAERRHGMRQPAPFVPAGATAGQGSLIARLSPKFEGARIEAVQAEDHYLRIHTDRGSALILMRLSEAVAELDPARGAQTHRSWWAARDAVVSSARGRGRALLTLKSGLRVPVSRTFAPALRSQGWF